MAKEEITFDEAALQADLDEFASSLGGEMQALVNKITETSSSISVLAGEIREKTRERRTLVGELASYRAQLAALANEA